MQSYRSSVASETQCRTSLCLEIKSSAFVEPTGPYKGTMSFGGGIQGRALKR